MNKKTSALRLLFALLCLAASLGLSGCLGRFASNQARRQAARSADHYVKNYAEPGLDELAGGDPAARADRRQARNDLADTIVRSGNERQKTRVGVDDRGWLTNEK